MHDGPRVDLPFVQPRVGLHHICVRARTRDDVDKCAALLREMGDDDRSGAWGE